MSGFSDLSNRKWWDSKSNSEKEELFDYIDEMSSLDEKALYKVDEYRTLSDGGFRVPTAGLRFLRRLDSER